MVESTILPDRAPSLMLAALFVIIRIVSNPLSNVFQKQLTRRDADPALILAVTHALLAVATLPLLLFRIIDWRQPAAFWTNMVPCAVLAVASNILLVQALRLTDLSVLGPLNAYKSVISLLLGIFLIGELPSMIGLAGMLLIVAGSVCIIDRQTGQRRRHALSAFLRDPGVHLRFAALVLSATEAVFLKRALHHAPALEVFTGWAQLCFPLAALAAWIRMRNQPSPMLAVLRPNLTAFLALALTTGLMQLTSLLTFARMQVGYSLALFQLSALLSVLLGHHFFQEGHLHKRLLGASIMVLGAGIIVTQH
jgi:drug/metabolite transporter (DMT)-like permease